ncbi:hypothetical protein SteCoe_15568 [Stentor coeruleus]|uniref:Uncharacterized protein n=1 Tax=Stentor coeruleus TaxID=5963 RepID=A0A1R2C357_9CILI|nr:hypothetical protein SteCoe_15568 [Stentor coeruleus]
MSNQNSICLNYFEDDSFVVKSFNRSRFIVKNCNKTHSRPGSNKKISEPVVLEKKVECLEKKQVLWKERGQVWDKEKRNLEKALKNACKDPNEYYRNLMNNWQNSQKKVVKKDNFFENGIEQLRGFLKWVLEQSGETPLKYVKDLAKEQVGFLDEIETTFSLRKQLMDNHKDQIIEELKQENEKLSEKMTVGIQDVINSLQEKTKESALVIASLEKSLEIVKEDNALMKLKVQDLNTKISVKDQEIEEFKSCNAILCERIEELKENIEVKKMIHYLPMQEITENTELVLERLLLQVKDLEEENIRLRKCYEISQYELENLKLFQKNTEKGKGVCKKIDFFSNKNAVTQTVGNVEGCIEKDFLQFSSCLASALENLLQGY